MPTGIANIKCDVTQRLFFIDRAQFFHSFHQISYEGERYHFLFGFTGHLSTVSFVFFNIALHNMYLLHRDKVKPKM